MIDCGFLIDNEAFVRLPWCKCQNLPAHPASVGIGNESALQRAILVPVEHAAVGQIRVLEEVVLVVVLIHPVNFGYRAQSPAAPLAKQGRPERGEATLCVVNVSKTSETPQARFVMMPARKCTKNIVTQLLYSDKDKQASEISMTASLQNK